MSPIFSRIGKLLASWKWVLGYTALLLLTLSQTRRFLGWLAERGLSGLLGVILFLAGIGCLFLLVRRIRRTQGGFTVFTWLRLVGFLALYLCCMFISTDLTVDRIHFIEYGIMGLLCFHAVSPEHRAGRRVSYTMVAVFAVGCLDEAIQGVLPNRYFDVRDLVIDLLAGFLPVLGLFVLPLYPGETQERAEPIPPSIRGAERSSQHFWATDLSALLLALCLLLGVLWVRRVPQDLAPIYGGWGRENPCGRFERMTIGRDGTILWEDAAGGKGRGTYRILGNRLDGPLLEVEVLEGQGSDACAWTTAERRHRYFRVDTERLLFTKERKFPFRRLHGSGWSSSSRVFRPRRPPRP